ncbi:hypothetical protein EYF80_057538 [Liparis tanakae]|uniref:Uncharacterized protein n=1 Tax=Liparis tanakae TaxID=230148 RepID=A0A4Z2EU29_9TELE|nr:hypothetical protein EYF80_057538 [Liparis tanakae]
MAFLQTAIRENSSLIGCLLPAPAGGSKRRVQVYSLFSVTPATGSSDYRGIGSTVGEMTFVLLVVFCLIHCPLANCDHSSSESDSDEVRMSSHASSSSSESDSDENGDGRPFPHWPSLPFWPFPGLWPQPPPPPPPPSPAPSTTPKPSSTRDPPPTTTAAETTESSRGDNNAVL